MAALFSWINRVDTSGAVISTDSEVSTLPVANITDRRVQKVWRTNAATTAYFGVDFGSALTVQALGVFGATLGATDTIRHRLSAVALGNGELLDTTAIACNADSAYLQSLYVLAASVTPRYWRCDIVATSRATQGYFDLGRAWAGPMWSPAINFSLGWSSGWVDPSAVERSMRSGAVFVDEGAIYRREAIQFDNLSEADRTQALELDRAAGRRGQVYYIPNYTAAVTTTGATSAILGRMTDTAPLSNPTDQYPARYTKTYILETDG